MNKYMLIFLPAIILLLSFYGCKSLTECENIQQKDAIILIDISDSILYDNIEKDLTQNFPGFMQRTKLGSITPCESFTLSFAHLSGKEALELSSESISITRKGQSKNEEKRQASPAPMVKLMAKTLSDYRILAANPAMNAGSNIANVLFKAIVSSDIESETTIVLLSDMVENNRLINFYKKIPDETELPFVIDNLIEPSVFEKFKSLQEQGLNFNIIIVLKPEPSAKTNLRNIKVFWIKLFEELKLNNQVQFIDNLTNTVEI